jgi:hypothetical protein
MATMWGGIGATDIPKNVRYFRAVSEEAGLRTMVSGSSAIRTLGTENGVTSKWRRTSGAAHSGAERTISAAH